MIEEVDRISRLPDALIHNILSFIDTKYAVQTSVLSKRWIHIWKSLPFLDFDIDCYTGVATQSDRSTNIDSYTRVKQPDRFTKFIDKVFQNRDDDCSIQRFRWRGVKRKVFRWFDASVERKIEEVTIEVLSGDSTTTPYEVPPRLLNCKSLKKLTLRQRTSQGIILPISMSLPHLKVMCLDGILVPDVESIKKLFSSCPLLETLNIVNCDIQTDNPWNLTIESPSLKQFAYTYRCNQYREHPFMPKYINLSAPNLTSFTCTSYLTHDYNLQNCFDHLSYANLTVLYSAKYQKQEVYAKRVVKLLLAVGKVKRLDLSSAFLEALWTATDWFSCHQLPWLCNLQSLKLEISLTAYSLRAMAYLLTVSPNVKSLILKSKKSPFETFGDGWDVEFSSPGLLLSHLNVVRLENAKGCDAELKILSILLKSATVLEEIDVFFRTAGRNVVNRFMDKLITIPQLQNGFVPTLIDNYNGKTRLTLRHLAV